MSIWQALSKFARWYRDRDVRSSLFFLRETTTRDATFNKLLREVPRAIKTLAFVLNDENWEKNDWKLCVEAGKSLAAIGTPLALEVLFERIERHPILAESADVHAIEVLEKQKRIRPLIPMAKLGAQNDLYSYRIHKDVAFRAVLAITTILDGAAQDQHQKDLEDCTSLKDFGYRKEQNTYGMGGDHLLACGDSGIRTWDVNTRDCSQVRQLARQELLRREKWKKEESKANAYRAKAGIRCRFLVKHRYCQTCNIGTTPQQQVCDKCGAPTEPLPRAFALAWSREEFPDLIRSEEDFDRLIIR